MAVVAHTSSGICIRVASSLATSFSASEDIGLYCALMCDQLFLSTRPTSRSLRSARPVLEPLMQDFPRARIGSLTFTYMRHLYAPCSMFAPSIAGSYHEPKSGLYARSCDRQVLKTAAVADAFFCRFDLQPSSALSGLYIVGPCSCAMAAALNKCKWLRFRIPSCKIVLQVYQSLLVQFNESLSGCLCNPHGCFSFRWEIAYIFGLLAV